MEDKLKRMYVAWARLGEIPLEHVIEEVYRLGKLDGRLEQFYKMHPELRNKKDNHAN